MEQAREPSAEREAEVSESGDNITSRELNSSVRGRGRRPYKAAGRRGIRVARTRSKSPDVVVARDSKSDSLAEGSIEKRSDESASTSTSYRVETTTLMRVPPHRLATGWRPLAQQLLHLNQLRALQQQILLLCRPLAYRLKYPRMSNQSAVHAFEIDKSAVRNSGVLPQIQLSWRKAVSPTGRPL